MRLAGRSCCVRVTRLDVLLIMFTLCHAGYSSDSNSHSETTWEARIKDTPKYTVLIDVRRFEIHLFVWHSLMVCGGTAVPYWGWAPLPRMPPCWGGWPMPLAGRSCCMKVTRLDLLLIPTGLCSTRNTSGHYTYILQILATLQETAGEMPIKYAVD
jgi:hypothetical protein